MKNQNQLGAMPYRTELWTVNPELSAILLQITDCKQRMRAYVESIRDRELHEAQKTDFDALDGDCVFGRIISVVSSMISAEIMFAASRRSDN